MPIFLWQYQGHEEQRLMGFLGQKNPIIVIYTASGLKENLVTGGDNAISGCEINLGREATFASNISMKCN